MVIANLRANRCKYNMDYQRKISNSPEKVSRKATFVTEEKSEYTTHLLPRGTDFSPEEEVFIDTGYMLKITSGPESGKKIILDRPLMSIGKLTGTERKGWILLNSSCISWDQATLKWMNREKKYGIIHSTGATIPTFVNDRAISSWEFTMLERGDVILTGNIRIIVCKIPGEIKSSFNKSPAVSEEKIECFGGKRNRRDREEELCPAGKVSLIKSNDFLPGNKNKCSCRDVCKAPSAFYPVINVIEGMDKGKTFHLVKNVNLIGRKSKNSDFIMDIELSKKDKSISRNHSRIVKKNGTYYIINEKEGNITLLNGLQVTEPVMLADGDKIELGFETVMVFHLLSGGNS